MKLNSQRVVALVLGLFIAGAMGCKSARKTSSNATSSSSINVRVNPEAAIFVL